TTFIVITVSMVLVAIAWILWPLLRSPGSRPVEVEHAAANVSIFKDQFADLDADLARGTISAEQHAEAKIELERRMLDEVRAAESSSAKRAGHRWPAVAVAMIAPIAAAAIYWQVGAPEALTAQLSTSTTATAGDEPISREQIEAMIVQVKQRLEKEPGNTEGWAILARTQYALGNFSDAVAAYAKLNALTPDDADILADYADAVAMSQGKSFAGQPMLLVQRALQINPTQWKALAMAGSEAFHRGDHRTAADYWQRLQDSSPPGSPVAKQIQGSIDEARRLAGLPPALSSSSPKEDAAVAGGGRSTGGQVSGIVALSPSVASKVQPDDAVFIYARPADGSRMPVAVVRARASDLPMQFTLDDSRAMAPNMKISNFPEVIVGARVSRSGKATPTSGDLEGATATVKVGASGVALSIDRVTP
ncbi:MAG: c-type cytochrome biogenesis protein CcmI, partial [Burkholderiaceae bacterium]